MHEARECSGHLRAGLASLSLDAGPGMEQGWLHGGGGGRRGALVSGKAMATEPGEAWTLLRQGRVSGWALLRMESVPWPPRVIPERAAQACCGRMWETSFSLSQGGGAQAGVRNLF